MNSCTLEFNNSLSPLTSYGKHDNTIEDYVRQVEGSNVGTYSSITPYFNPKPSSMEEEYDPEENRVRKNERDRKKRENKIKRSSEMGY